MNTDQATRLLDDYEQGRMSRRDLITGLMGLGAAMAAAGRAGAAQADTAPERLFQGQGLDHIALNVTDIARSRAFYQKHLGLEVLRDGGAERCFMGPPGQEFILALFRSDKPGMNHYCYGIPEYQPDEVMRTLGDAGARPRREGNRIYFPDPDGLVVQLAQAGAD